MKVMAVMSDRSSRATICPASALGIASTGAYPRHGCGNADDREPSPSSAREARLGAIRGTLDVPVLAAREGRAGGRLDSHSNAFIRWLLFAAVMLSGLAVLSAAFDWSGPVGHACRRAFVGHWRGRSSASIVWLAQHRTLVADGSLADRVDHRRRGRTADRRGGDRGRLRSAAEMADRGLRRLRAGGRSGGVPGDDARRSYAPASRRSSREFASRTRVIRRGTLRPPLRSTEASPFCSPRGSRTASSGQLRGSSRSCWWLLSPPRVCIAECITRSTLPVACSSVSAR